MEALCKISIKRPVKKAIKKNIANKNPTFIEKNSDAISIDEVPLEGFRY